MAVNGTWFAQRADCIARQIDYFQCCNMGAGFDFEVVWCGFDTIPNLISMVF
jgi:hypothetical protein